MILRFRNTRNGREGDSYVSFASLGLHRLSSQGVRSFVRHLDSMSLSGHEILQHEQNLGTTQIIRFHERVGAVLGFQF
jgi:hypothetical protein